MFTTTLTTWGSNGWPALTPGSVVAGRRVSHHFEPRLASRGVQAEATVEQVMSIAIVVLTSDRLPLFRQCVQNVLSVTSDSTSEILIWDNGSVDGTAEFLARLDDPRITIVTSPTNVGMVAYGRAIDMTSAEYIIQVDDDVIMAPPRWDEQLLAAFRAVPRMAWLSADLEDNPTDRASYDRHYSYHYLSTTMNGVPLLLGPTGGGCTITSREIYDSVGGRRRRGVPSTSARTRST